MGIEVWSWLLGNLFAHIHYNSQWRSCNGSVVKTLVSQLRGPCFKSACRSNCVLRQGTLSWLLTHEQLAFFVARQNKSNPTQNRCAFVNCLGLPRLLVISFNQYLIFPRSFCCAILHYTYVSVRRRISCSQISLTSSFQIWTCLSSVPSFSINKLGMRTCMARVKSN